MSGIILLVGGIYAFDFKLSHRRFLLANAILDLVIGPLFLMTFGFGFSFAVIVVLFGLHAAELGAFFLMIAIHTGRQERASYLLGLAGVVSLFTGAYLILFRSMSPGKLTLAGAIYTVIFGLLLLIFAIDLRTTHRKLHKSF